MKKILRAANWARNYGVCPFLKVAPLVFLDIAQDRSLGQCLTTSRVETLKKKNIAAQIGAEMIFSIPMSSSAHSTCLFLLDLSSRSTNLL